jgi:CBS domain containing-hemolysin-like protein
VESDLVLWALILAVAAVFYLLFAAADVYTHEVTPARERLDVALRQPSRTEALQEFIEQRERQLACLAWARLGSIAVAMAMSSLITTQYISGSAWGTAGGLLVTGFALALLQSPVRALAENQPEAWGRVARPAVWLAHAAFSHIVWVAQAPARFLTRHTPADETSRSMREAQHLLRLVEMEEEAGVIEQDEREMIRGVIGMVDTEVAEVMIPRTDLVAVDADTEFDEVLRIFVERGLSRIPLFEETVDRIIGVIYAKDCLRRIVEGRRPQRLSELAREPFFIPETKRVDELLGEFRLHKVHFAVVVDEYGGTAGIVTIEDLLEEIVGEIEDEYDTTPASVERVSDVEVKVDGRLPVSELEELLQVEIPHEDVDTVGGMVFSALGRIPAPGETARVGSLDLTAAVVLGRRVKTVRVLYHPEPVEEPVEAEGRPA